MREAPPSAKHLQEIFARIHAERMEGIPILNPKLTVEVVGTRSWHDHTLTALITPWSINLMLLPAGEEDCAAWKSLQLGSNVVHRFPAGRFDFLVGEEDGIGRYQMCSLFSPVLEFEDQEAARVAAAAALQALFDASLEPTAAKAGNASKPEPAGKSHNNEGVPDPTRRAVITGRIGPREGPQS